MAGAAAAAAKAAASTAAVAAGAGGNTRVHATRALFGGDKSVSMNVLVVLNSPGISSTTLRWLIRRADLCVCADGGANRVFDSSPPAKASGSEGVSTGSAGFLPHAVTGDLDSLRPDVRRFYESRGVPVVETPDQNRNDFQKCVAHVLDEEKGLARQDARLRRSGGKAEVTIRRNLLVAGAMGGRFDQTVCNMSVALRLAEDGAFHSIALFSDDSMVIPLLPGKHRVLSDAAVEANPCESLVLRRRGLMRRRRAGSCCVFHSPPKRIHRRRPPPRLSCVRNNARPQVGPLPRRHRANRRRVGRDR